MTATVLAFGGFLILGMFIGISLLSMIILSEIMDVDADDWMLFRIFKYAFLGWIFLVILGLFGALVAAVVLLVGGR